MSYRTKPIVIIALVVSARSTQCAYEKLGFREVYQIDGGIVKYGEKYADEGLRKVACIFDKHMNVELLTK